MIVQHDALGLDVGIELRAITHTGYVWLKNAIKEHPNADLYLFLGKIDEVKLQQNVIDALTNDGYDLKYRPAFLSKLSEVILSGHIAYGVRIIANDKKYNLLVTFKIHRVPLIGFQRGAIGVDFNHGTIDLAVLNPQGQLRTTRTLQCHDLTCAHKDKRSNRLGNLAKQIVAFAKYWGRGLVLENLQGVTRGQSNQHQFGHRRFLEAVSRRAEKQGVLVRRINPAYTSVIGAWKYAPYYNITVHQAAALVIARRGQGLKEPLRKLKTLVVKPMEGSDASEYALSRRVHAWSLWQRLKVLPLQKGACRRHPDQANPIFWDGQESRGTCGTTRRFRDDQERREIINSGCGPPLQV